MKKKRFEPMTAEQEKELRPDWTNPCEVCGAFPIVPVTGLCGPCTWGEADTVNGGWWDDKRDAPI